MSELRTVLAAAIVLIFAAAAPAGAAEIKRQFELDQRYEWNDNFGLRVRNEEEVSGYTISPSGGIESVDERNTFGANLDLDFSFYDLSDLDSSDQKLGLYFQRLQERGRWGISANLTRDSTRSSEFDTTGVIQLDAQRRVVAAVRPSWTYVLTPKNEITLSGDVQSVSYDSEFFADYDYDSVSLGWRHLFSPRVSGDLTLFSARYDYDLPGGLASETESTGLQYGLSRVFSERLTGSFSLGVRETENKSQRTVLRFVPPFSFEEVLIDQSAKSSGGLAEFRLSYAGEHTDTSIAVSRSLSASGIGQVLEADNLNFRIRHRLFERTRIILDIVAYDNTAVDEEVAFNRTFVRVWPHFSWRMTQHWTLDGGYRYQTQEYNVGGEAEGNAIIINVRYDHRPGRW